MSLDVCTRVQSAPSRQPRKVNRRSQRSSWPVVATIAVAVLGLCQAPSAAADFTDNLSVAVLQVRGGTSCGPLESDPLASKTAEIAVRSTDTYLKNQARAVPVADPLPILEDLGVNAGRAKLLQGAGKTEADAIKFILVAGFRDIPDCSYQHFGVSTLPNDNPNGYFLSALVLVGA